MGRIHIACIHTLSNFGSEIFQDPAFLTPPSLAMTEWAPAESVRTLESRKWSCATLLDGVANVLIDADMELPDDLEQLEDSKCSSQLNTHNLIDAHCTCYALTS